MRILHIHDYPPMEGGGVEVNVSRVCEALANQGHTVTIATSRFNSETYQSKNLPDTFTTKGGVVISHIKGVPEIRRLVDQSDVPHIHLTFSCRPASLAALEHCVKTDKKCVASLRTNIEHVPYSALSGLDPKQKLARLQKLSRLLTSPSVTVSAPTRDVQRSLKTLEIDKQVEVIRNGISVLMNHRVRPVEKKLPVVDLTYIGEVSRLKGTNYLIEAVLMLSIHFPKLKVRLVGSGQDLNEMKMLVRRYQLQRTIKFVGYVENKKIHRYLSATKLLVHPSLTEVWPNAVAEALALGVPVIATSVGGIPEMLKHGTYGLLVKPADSVALYRKIKFILANPDQRLELKAKAAKARRDFTKKYTLENQAYQLSKLYNKVLYA